MITIHEFLHASAVVELMSCSCDQHWCSFVQSLYKEIENVPGNSDINKKFFLLCISNNYNKSKLLEAKHRVQQFKCVDLLKEYRKASPVEDPLVFVLPFSLDVGLIKKYISQFEKDIFI